MLLQQNVHFLNLKLHYVRRFGMSWRFCIEVFEIFVYFRRVLCSKLSASWFTFIGNKDLLRCFVGADALLRCFILYVKMGLPKQVRVKFCQFFFRVMQAGSSFQLVKQSYKTHIQFVSLGCCSNSKCFVFLIQN